MKTKFKNLNLKKGMYGLKALESGKLSQQEFDSFKKVIRKRVKKKGFMWFNLYPYLQYSLKSAQSRMGGGRGKIFGTYCNVYKGQILFEVYGLPFNIVKKISVLAFAKLCIRVKLIKKTNSLQNVN
jgi:large subunit ribosomal protein L16